jgi:hypothetical protein
MRTTTPAPNFDLSVVFAPDEEDLSAFFRGPTGVDMARLTANNEVLMKWRFHVWPTWSMSTFEECVIRLGEEEFRALAPERDQTGNESQIRNRIRISGARYTDDVNNRDLGFDSRPDGRARLYFRKTYKLAANLAPLKNVRLVAAHRVVTPTMNLQTVESLPSGGEQLAGFLQTLQGRDRKTFNAIETLVTEIFPEFEFVNPSSVSNTVSIKLTDRRTRQEIPLTHCGTGVEQVLTLATFVLTSLPGAVLLLDEPHSYLHPVAERMLIDFLKSQSNATIVISTHSAIMINSRSGQN